jgi:hypothetical protein
MSEASQDRQFWPDSLVRCQDDAALPEGYRLLTSGACG